MKKIVLIVVIIVLGIFAWRFFSSQNADQGIVPGAGQGTDIKTSADNAPPGSIHNLPVPDAVAAARARAAQDAGVDEGVAIVMTAYEKEWPNACLGLETEGEMCAQVITPGYEVTVQAGGELYSYRTNSDGTVVRPE